MDHTLNKIAVPWMDNHQTMLDFQRIMVDGERAAALSEGIMRDFFTAIGLIFMALASRVWKRITGRRLFFMK